MLGCTGGGVNLGRWVVTELAPNRFLAGAGVNHGMKAHIKARSEEDLLQYYLQM